MRRRKTPKAPAVLQPHPPSGQAAKGRAPSERAAKDHDGPTVLIRYTKEWGLGALLCSDPMIDGLIARHGPGTRIYIAGPAGNVLHHPRIAGPHRAGVQTDHTIDVRRFQSMTAEESGALEALPGLIGHMCSYADLDPGDTRPELHLRAREREVAKRFRKLDLSGPVVGLCADTIDPLRHWPLEEWRELARWLQAQGCTVVNLGVRDTTGVGIELVGKLGIRDAAAVLGTCDLFVGNNSGLFHYAQAARVPCVATFSLATPSRFVHPGATVIPVQADLPCVDCMSRCFVAMQRTGCIAAPRGRCMLEISQGMMRDAVERALAGARQPVPA